MLLVQKAVGEGGLALGLYAALLVDRRAVDPQTHRRERANLLLEIITPIYKAYISERALEANDLSIQVLGGYGYTRDYPVEQFYRDNRLNPIHEGTNGVQAIDLLGRKVRQQDGAALETLLAEMRATAEAAAVQPELAAEAAQLVAALDLWESTTAQMVAAARQAGERAYLANASLYMALAGQVTLAWIWLWQALESLDALEAAPDTPKAGFYRGKLQTCRYVFRFELPRVAPLADVLARLDATCLDMQSTWF